MSKKHQLINFNHISNKLTSEEVDELKSYYITYYRLTWAYKKMFKFLQRLNVSLHILSGVLGGASISAAVGTGGFAFLALGSVSIGIQVIINQKNLSSRIENTKRIYQLLETLNISIKESLRLVVTVTCHF